MKRVTILALVLVVIAGGIVLAQSAPQTVSQTVAAIVNGEVITKATLNSASQLNQIIQSLFSQHYLFVEVMFTTKEGKAFIDRYQRAVLDQLINDRLLVQQATVLKIPVDDNKVDQQVTNRLNQIMQQNNLTLDQIDSILQKQGSSLAEYKAKLRKSFREQLLVQGLHDRIVGDATVSEDEISAYYTAHQKDYTDDKGNVTPLAQVHDKIHATLLKQAQDKIWNDWFAKVKAQAKIEINM